MRDDDTVPRHLRIALANATDAFRTGTTARLGTVNETIQPLVDAAMQHAGVRHDHGVRDERAAVVAWLRREAAAPIRDVDWRAPHTRGSGDVQAQPTIALMEALADMIEAGRHHRDRG